MMTTPYSNPTYKQLDFALDALNGLAELYQLPAYYEDWAFDDPCMVPACQDRARFILLGPDYIMCLHHTLHSTAGGKLVDVYRS